MTDCLILPVFIMTTFIFNATTPMLCEGEHYNKEHHLLNNSKLVFDSVNNFVFRKQTIYFYGESNIEFNNSTGLFQDDTFILFQDNKFMSKRYNDRLIS